MVTKDSAPSMQSRSATAPTGEESVTPVIQPCETIQRAQVGSLIGSDKTKEPPEKTPKKQSPALAARPKKYALEMWVEIETSAGMYSARRKTLIALILQLTLSTMPIQVVLA